MIICIMIGLVIQILDIGDTEKILIGMVKHNIVLGFGIYISIMIQETKKDNDYEFPKI